jgi:uncharacterized alpha-E superfamily protein
MMLSRVANSIYWMSRYIERAENVARSMEVNNYLNLDLAGVEQEQWAPLVDISGSSDDFHVRYAATTRTDVIQFLAFDRLNANSILSCLQAARENARAIRSVLPSELWEQLNRMYLYVSQLSCQTGVFDNPHEFFTRLKLGSQLFIGVTEVAMTHDEAWHFCRLGQSLERADQTTRLLDVKHFLLLPSPDHVELAMNDIQWAALLRSASAFEMYRRRFGEIQPERIIAFLLREQAFPRAVLACLNRAEECLRNIIGTSDMHFNSPPVQRLGKLRASLAYSGVKEILQQGLHIYLDRLQAELNMLDNDLYHTFFAPLQGDPAALGQTGEQA